MLQIISLARVMGALVRGLKSRTTKDQWAGNIVFLILACVVGTLLIVYGGMSEDVVLGGIVAAQTLIGPYFGRAMSWVHSWVQGKVKVDSALMCSRVKYKGMGWRVVSMTLMDAREEGWDYAMLRDGTEVRLKFMEKTGRKVRLRPTAAKKGN